MSCIMMSENPTNRYWFGKSSDFPHQHVDVKVHFLRDLVHDGHVNLLKYAGPQNVSDSFTKRLSRPAFEKHVEFMIGTRVPFSAFYPMVSTVVSIVLVDNVREDNYSSTRGRSK